MASFSATAARMWIVRRFAWGLSHATKSTPDSNRFARKATLRARRSNFAIRNVHHGDGRCVSLCGAAKPTGKSGGV